MDTGCLPEINVTVAIEKGLCQAGTETSDGCFEQALLPKPVVLLPAASMPLCLDKVFGWLQ